MILRAIFCVLSLFICLLIIYRPVEKHIKWSISTKSLFIFYVIIRISGFIFVYIVFPGIIKNSDLMLYYYNEINRTLFGEVPNINFLSSYGPLFHYIGIIFLYVYDSPASIGFMIIIFEFLSTILLILVIVKHGNKILKENVNSIIYLIIFNPGGWYWTGLTNYNTIMINVFWLLGIYFIMMERDILSSISVSLSVIACKLLGFLYFPLYLMLGFSRILKISISLLLVFTLYIFISIKFNMNVILPVLREFGKSTSGNVWFLFSGTSIFLKYDFIWKWAPIIILLVSNIVFLLYARKYFRNDVMFYAGSISGLCILFMILSRKSYPHYMPMYLNLLIIFIFSCKGPIFMPLFIFLVQGIICVFEPVLWNSLGQPKYLITIDYGLKKNLLIFIDGLFVGTNIYYLFFIFRSIKNGIT